MGDHIIISPPGLAPAVGYSHGVIAAPGRTLYIAGEIAWDSDSRIVGETWAEQFDAALSNLAAVLAEAGGEPEHLVWMQIFTADVEAYREARRELGPIWRQHLGKNYPAMGLYGVTQLADEGALLEITAIAVIPD